MNGRWNGENSVVIRHDQDERRRDMLNAEAEAHDRLALEDEPNELKRCPYWRDEEQKNGTNCAAELQDCPPNAGHDCRIQEADQCPRK